MKDKKEAVQYQSQIENEPLRNLRMPDMHHFDNESFRQIFTPIQKAFSALLESKPLFSISFSCALETKGSLRKVCIRLCWDDVSQNTISTKPKVLGFA